MIPSTDNELSLSTYVFQDSDTTVIVTLYANGVFEQNRVEIECDVDNLEVTTPVNEKWSFQLYGNIFLDRTEFTTERNDAKNQTIIKVILYKQQAALVWPQLHSIKSVPITPQRNNQNNVIHNSQIESSTIEQPEPYYLAMKKLDSTFSEHIPEKAISRINIKQVYDFQVKFTETNVTIIFRTSDERFFQLHSIPSNRPIRLFIHVKERIVPEKCSYEVTSSYMEIKLHKENAYGNYWYRLEANEYSESNPLLTVSGLPRILPPRTPGMNLTKNTVEGYPKQTLASVDRLPLPKDTTYMLNTSLVPSTGYTGIYNPANSCFMNAAIQCLSNTRELRDYFLKSYHILEINKVNPLGMKGAMAEEFGSIIKELWDGKYSYIDANKLRDFVAQRHQEFVGNGQHDAQELLTIVLDAIHEDLNRVIQKPLVPPVEAENRPDHVIADEYWRGYLSRNDSIIVQLFTGQFKSKTKCPQCHKESVTFDPFTSISVPLPKRVAIDAIVIFRNENKPPTKYRVIMSSDGSIAELKRLLSNKCGVSFSKMLAYKAQSSRYMERLKDDDRVTVSSYSWSNIDMTYIAETLTSAECNNETIYQLECYQRIFKLSDYVSACSYCQTIPQPHSSPINCEKCYRVSYCDELCRKLHASEHKRACDFRSTDNYEFVGLPFIISLPESKLTCENVFQQISIYAKYSVDIHLNRSKQTRRSFATGHTFYDYDRDMDADEEESFSDIENVDWTTIKSTLASADSWSIVRIGDYFVKTNKTKRHQQSLEKENNNDQEESMITNDDSSSNISEDFDMVDDIYGSQPLFRITPRSTHYSDDDFPPIVEPGIDADRVLRSHTIFSIDWFTDNDTEAALRVTSSKYRSGLNGLVEDESVLNSISGDQEVTLQQCLQLFIEPEVLGPDDKWFCPHCKEHIQAEKKMSIWRLPPILIIHLKRFKYSHYSAYGGMSSSREKIETTVKFPTHDLNVVPYCSSINEENQQEDNAPQARYDLYGVINHRGSAWFGHYTSYARLLSYNDSAKTDIGWRHFDDQHVSSLASVKDVVRPDAYVLFYRNRNLPVTVAVQEQLERTLSQSINT